MTKQEQITENQTEQLENYKELVTIDQELIETYKEQRLLFEEQIEDLSFVSKVQKEEIKYLRKKLEENKISF